MRRIAPQAAAVVFACLVSAQSSGAVAQQKTVITVASTSDRMDGDVTSVAALLANPGRDGISLREAIAATNNDPGTYTIRFSSRSTITLRSDLPALTGGGVVLDGDIDGDDKPDVTLRPLGKRAQVGFKISSSRNRLLALELRSFMFGVVVQPPVNPVPTRRTFADNVVNGLVLSGIGKHGIVLDPTALGDCRVPCGSRNTWVETTITGNTVESKAGGISVWNASTAERVRNVTVTDNEVTITGMAIASGISFETAGPLGGRETTGARISDVLIARNSVRGSPDIGINVAAGTGRGQNGTIERVRVLANRVHLVQRGAYYCCFGIVVQAGSDSPEFAEGPPVRYLDDNIVREVVVRGNTVSGTLEWGIAVHAGFGGGGSRNQIRNVRIEQNVFRSSKPTFGALVLTGDGPAYRKRYASGNRISGLSIERNRLTIASGPNFELAGGGIGAAGVALVGGHRLGRGNVVREVRIVQNRITSPYAGIKLIGGLGPTASGNRVTCVRLSGNRVTGTRKAVSVEPNREGASGNRASLGGC